MRRTYRAPLVGVLTVGVLGVYHPVASAAGPPVTVSLRIVGHGNTTNG
ncbi:MULTISPECIES: hypothetical protein [unclassified Streptomyces]